MSDSEKLNFLDEKTLKIIENSSEDSLYPKKIDSFTVKFEVFEGPLDLMLDSISKKKLNIFDIDISIILDEFLLYIQKTKEAEIELAIGFFTTCARLIYIKTALLLPQHKEDALDMKKELQGELIERALTIAAGEKLSEMYLGDVIFTRPPDKKYLNIKTYNISHIHFELFRIYNDIAATPGGRKPSLPAPENVTDIAPKAFVSIEEKLSYILQRLVKYGVFPLDELYNGQKRSEQAAVFLAILELIKTGRVKITSDSDDEFQYIELNKNE